MPFKSKQQAKWMFSQKPAMAKEWAAETPSITALPSKKRSGGTFVPLKGKGMKK
jgi:hypothetical protein